MYDWLLRALRALAWEPRYFLGSVLVPIAIVAFVLQYSPFGGTPTDRARWASGILELLGTLVVVSGLLDRRKLFGTTDAAIALTEWLERVVAVFLPTPVRKIVLAAGSAIAAATVTGSAELTVADDSLDGRVKRLEGKVAALQKSLNDARSNLSSDIERARRELSAAVAEVRMELDDLAAKTRALSVGSLGFEMMGLTWLLAGIALGTWPQLAIAFARPA